ncbi:transglycosylase domain-containing protein [Actinokineospora enzanensis]|uniref:transglycosylase domain-containing protein n=1 Tax=Actinokineospora enzanensis TaxID=155975 RepID=UPI000361F5E6|nr:transglycosylase domain-containing protein [Actinokineospora enzanensis]
MAVTPPRDDRTVALKTAGVAGAAGAAGEAPTVFMPKNPGQSRSEPQLLTHREPEPDLDDGYQDEAEMEADAPTEEELRKKRRKKIWRRVRRTCYVLAGLMIIGPILAFFITYQLVDVDNPQDIARDQDKVVTLLYADGSEMSKIGTAEANRVMLKPEEIPDTIKHAVYAAEDQTFETNSGFDITGILRAAWNNVTGGGGGGSTISQQYIKKATGNDDPTLTRKWVEVVKAYKMTKTYDKKDIITAYLNTIYFGRGAYGIAAAAKAYYGETDLTKITKSQAAVLAGMIQTPSRGKDIGYQQSRWKYVTGRMVDNGWMTPAEKAEATFPEPITNDKTKAASLTGPRARIPILVQNELESLGYDEDRIKKNGYKITTTIDPRAQQLAEEAVSKVMLGQPDNLRPGLVAVDPATGSVLAYYGGADPNGTDWAGSAIQPGSSFKPFDLVGLLRKGEGLTKTYDSGPVTINPGSKKPITVTNAGKTSCGAECPVAQAMKESLNTVFTRMVMTDVKPEAVAQAARDAGVTSDLSKAETLNIAIGGGDTRVTVRDMATAFATFADGGTRRPSHLVAKIEFPNGGTAWEAATEERYKEAPAFDENDPDHNQKIARNVTESLRPIPQSSGIPCAGGRDCAGKTGTHQYVNREGVETKDNGKAWMVGYTPQISAAVGMATQDSEPLKDKTGRTFYGSGLPGHIWQQFMNSYLAQAPKVDFGKYVAIGETTKPTTVAPKTTTAEAPATTTTTANQPTVPTTTTEDGETTTTTTTKHGGGGGGATTTTRTPPTGGTVIPIPGQNG